jgi:hypothetical protein
MLHNAIYVPTVIQDPYNSAFHRRRNQQQKPKLHDQHVNASLNKIDNSINRFRSRGQITLSQF